MKERSYKGADMRNKKSIGASDGLPGRPIRLNKVTLSVPRGEEYAELMFIGDSHYGSPQFDEPRFLAMLDYCLKNRLHIILMGDLLETATRNSVGAGVYEQEGPAMDQHEQMCEWLRPLAEAELIIGAHLGNHEFRIYQDSGFNVTKAMCRELNIRYLGDACWTHLKVGKEKYVIYSLHGRTGSRFDGTALLAVERISTSFFADLLAMGHTHKLVTSSVIVQRVVNGLVKEFKKYLLLTGSFLKYDGGYAQTLGLPLSKLGAPKVKFYAKRHDLFITW
jgi:UDP-2,3-diacylglucosamine pyrophosphatase LpxH